MFVTTVNQVLLPTVAITIMKRFVRYPKEETDTFLIILLFLALCFLAISAFS